MAIDFFPKNKKLVASTEYVKNSFFILILEQTNLKKFTE